MNGETLVILISMILSVDAELPEVVSKITMVDNKSYVIKDYDTLVSARCNIYISRLCYDVSIHLSVRLSVTEVHWHIIANLGFKFRSHFTAHCGRRAACGRIISHHASQC